MYETDAENTCVSIVQKVFFCRHYYCRSFSSSSETIWQMKGWQCFKGKTKKYIYDAAIILQREVDIHRVLRVYKRERHPSESKKEKIMLSCHYHGSWYIAALIVLWMQVWEKPVPFQLSIQFIHTRRFIHIE